MEIPRIGFELEGGRAQAGELEEKRQQANPLSSSTLPRTVTRGMRVDQYTSDVWRMDTLFRACISVACAYTMRMVAGRQAANQIW